MGTVTQYNMANIRDALGGSNPVSLSQYYRGGARVPSTRNTTVQTRDPTSGEYYVRYGFTNRYYWGQNSSGYNPGSTAGSSLAYFANALIFSSSSNVSSYTSGNVTYYRGTFQLFEFYSSYCESLNYFGIYKITTTGGTVSINTGVPSSGQISISQLYGAENP
jgi:hypothetical protein